MFRPVTSQGGTVPNFESTISDVTDTFKLFMYTFVPRNNVENIGVEVLCMDAPNSYIDIDIAAWKLELGAQQTLAHQDINGNWVLNDPPPNKALELLKCQRYLAAYRSAEIYNASVFFGTGILDGYDAEGNTSGQGYIVMPCAMRATPAIIGPAAIYSSVVNAPIIRIDIIGVTGNVLRFNFTVTGQVSLEQRMCMIWTAGDLFVTADL